MKIAVVGWGSLIWNPGTLLTSGAWNADGPRLPIEFARIADDRRLTLVIYPPAEDVRALWIRAASERLDEVIENLEDRERSSTEDVGFVSLSTGRYRARFPELIGRFQTWAAARSLEAVVWTDLESTFERRSGRPFTHANAIDYLRELRGVERDKAEEYIRKAPRQTDTLLRRRIESELGRTPAE